MSSQTALVVTRARSKALRPAQVFGAKEWDALVQRSILPKLAWALRDALAIDPRGQDLAAWRWVAAWAPVLAPGALAGLLEQHFFPKWHAVLRHWLAHAPDFDEVTAWFLGWKARPRARGRAEAALRVFPQKARIRLTLARSSAGFWVED